MGAGSLDYLRSQKPSPKLGVHDAHLQGRIRGYSHRTEKEDQQLKASIFVSDSPWQWWGYPLPWASVPAS